MYRWREGAIHAETAQSTLTVFLKDCSGLLSVISIVLSTVSLHLQSPFAPIPLVPVLRIVVAYVMGTVSSSCS